MARFTMTLTVKQLCRHLMQQRSCSSPRPGRSQAEVPSEASGGSGIAHRTHTWVSHPGLHQCSQLLRSLTISSPVKAMGKHSFCITTHIRCRKTKRVRTETRAAASALSGAAGVATGGSQDLKVPKPQRCAVTANTHRLQRLRTKTRNTSQWFLALTTC